MNLTSLQKHVQHVKTKGAANTYRELHRCSKFPPSSVPVDWDILEVKWSEEGQITLHSTQREREK